MRLFRHLVWAALALALITGTLQTGVQHLWAVPIILKAETFEDQKAEPAPSPHDAAGATAHADADATHAGHDAANAWAPQDGAERIFWTWVANVLHDFGMALLVLVALASWVWRRGTSTPAWLLALGVAAVGFLSLHLWPALGLPAEIPGMEAARLGSRQGWWLLAAGSALAACGAIAFGHGAWRWAVATACLAAPFAVGAPHLAADPLAGFGPQAQDVLRGLEQDFVIVTHAVALSLWLSLGVAGTWAFRRWVQPLLPTGGATRAQAPLASHIH